MNFLKPRLRLRGLGVVAAVALAFGAATAPPALARPQLVGSTHAESGPAAVAGEQAPGAGQEQAGPQAEEPRSGGALWVLIVVGLLIGIGIGLAIVFRAKRRAPGDRR